MFFGRNDAKAETPVLWPPHVKSWLIGKRLWCCEGLWAGGEGDDRGWDGWMASPTRWIKFEWTAVVGDGQGGLACCDSWGRKESNMTERLNWTELTWNIPLVSLTFLRRSLVFPILLFSSISLHRSLRKAFLSLLAILWNFAFKWVYLSFSSLPWASLFSVIFKTSSDNHFAFLHFFFLGMVLITASCTVSRTTIHNSSGTLSDLIPWIYLSLLLYNSKGFDLGHT